MNLVEPPKGLYYIQPAQVFLFNKLQIIIMIAYWHNYINHIQAPGSGHRQ